MEFVCFRSNSNFADSDSVISTVTNVSLRSFFPLKFIPYNLGSGPFKLNPNAADEVDEVDL